MANQFDVFLHEGGVYSEVEPVIRYALAIYEKQLAETRAAPNRALDDAAAAR